LLSVKTSDCGREDLFLQRDVHLMTRLTSILVLCLLFHCAVLAQSGPPKGTGNWKLIFEENFDGTQLDNNKWIPCWHWGTLEGGCNNSPGGRMLSWVFPRNVSVRNGALEMRAVKENYTTPWDKKTYNWTSGMVTTDRLDNKDRSTPRFSFLYGYMEARMRLPSGSGIYTAFWTTSSDHKWPPEIDVIERIADRGELFHLSMHWPNGTPGGGALSQAYVDDSFKDGKWHTFAALWDPEKVVWYMDGREVTRFRDKSQIPQVAQNLLLSTEVWSPSSGWTKGPDANTPSVNTTYVDHVRVWQRNEGSVVPLPYPAKVQPAARFGTSGIDTSTYDKATDGNVTTAFDAWAATGGYAGIDAGKPVTVDMVRFWPRLWQERRMLGGKFQASNSKDGPWTDLFTIKQWPSSAYTAARFANNKAYQFYRYLGPTDGHSNIAEMEFYLATTQSAPDPTPGPTPAPTPRPSPTATPSPTPTPQPRAQTAPFRIDTGAAAEYKDSDGNIWQPDNGYLGGATVNRGGLDIANTEDDPLYRTERWGMSGYHFKVDNGSYIVTLHFAETFEWVTAPAKRVFSINVEGKSLNDFDIYSETGGRNRALVKSFECSVTDGVLNINFTGKVDSPIINAIEVDQVASFSLALQKGWNLVSVPVKLHKPNIQDAFQSIKGRFDSVYTYDTDKTQYRAYTPTSKENDLTLIEPGKGYWIEMKESATLTISGRSASTTSRLIPGWNLVGYSGQKSRSVESATASIKSKLLAVYLYVSSSNSYRGYEPGSGGDLTTMDPGKGYWIYVTDDVEWSY
jgi:beta-glucanase (GH16 family)